MASEVILEPFQILQIIGSLISIFLISRAVIDYRKNRIGKNGFLLWVLIWSLALVAFLVPSSTKSIFQSLTTGNTLIVALILANVFLFILAYSLFQQLSSLNTRFKLFIQKLAIDENLDKKDKNTTDEKQ